MPVVTPNPSRHFKERNRVSDLQLATGTRTSWMRGSKNGYVFWRLYAVFGKTIYTEEFRVTLDELASPGGPAIAAMMLRDRRNRMRAEAP